MQSTSTQLLKESMTITITINTEAFNDLADDDAPLYVEHRGQPYRAMLYLDENGKCSLETAGPWENSVPARVWNRCTLTWSLPAEIKGHVLHDKLTSESVLELLQRVYEGHDVEWDGHNWSGTLDEDAQEAYDELQHILEQGWNSRDSWSVWSAVEWLSRTNLGDAWPAGKSIQEAAEDVIRNAADNDVLCGTAGDVESALRDKLREEIQSDDDFEPSPEQLAALDD